MAMKRVTKTVAWRQRLLGKLSLLQYGKIYALTFTTASFIGQVGTFRKKDFTEPSGVTALSYFKVEDKDTYFRTSASPNTAPHSLSR